MSLGSETVTPSTRAVRTSSPFPDGWTRFRLSELRSSELMSPRLLTESSRRSSWLYWSLVTPNQTQAPSVMTRATTESAATITMMRNESTRVSSRFCRWLRCTRTLAAPDRTYLSSCRMLAVADYDTTSESRAVSSG